MAIFGILYALKGGSGNILTWWDRVRATNKFTERLMDGKIISTIGAFLFALLFNVTTVSVDGGAYGVPEYAVHFWPALVFAGAWLLSVAPSMGEEHGAVGRIGNAWGEYVEYDEDFGRSYGIKKAIQRGVWMGAIMAFATGYIWYIPASLLFVPAVFAGQQLGYMIFKRDGWVLSEPLIGAFVFGLPTYFWLA